MQTKAVLFDLDGTLVDSLPTLTCSLNAYLAALGKAPFTEKEVSDMVGKGVRVLLQKAFACRQVRLAGASFDAAVKGARYAPGCGRGARGVCRGLCDGRRLPQRCACGTQCKDDRAPCCLRV